MSQVPAHWPNVRVSGGSDCVLKGVLWTASSTAGTCGSCTVLSHGLKVLNANVLRLHHVVCCSRMRRALCAP